MAAHPFLASAALLALVPLFCAVRLWPTWQARARGCDAFYFLLSADTFRRERRLPIVLPALYLLEPTEQWYPPGFSIFLGLLPRGFVERYHWLLSHALDMLVLITVIVVTLEAYGPTAALIAGIGYAFASALLIEYAALTSRALAMVMFAAFLIGSYAWTEGWTPGLAIAILAGIGLLLTHKLTVQLLWFLVPFLAAVEAEPFWLLPLVASYAGAFLVAPRLMVKILRAHWDIVSFWHRNWRYLGAHQVRSSPIYGDGRPGGFHHGSLWKAAIAHARLLFQLNPWTVAVPVALWQFSSLAELEQFLLLAVLGIYAWAALTLYVHPLKCLGEGTKYVKFALPLTIILAAALPYSLPPEEAWIAWAVLAAAGLLQLAHYAWIARWLRRAPQDMGVISPDLVPLLDRIAETPGARLLCLPTHLADAVAYKTRQPVLWGTHGYGFRDAEPFFPVLRKPLDYFVAHYRLTHLLIDTRFTSLCELRIAPGREDIESGRYRLTSFNGTTERA